MVSMDDRVQSLCEAAGTLNSTADKLTKHIKRMEDALKKSGVGVVHKSSEPFYTFARAPVFDEQGDLMTFDAVDTHLQWIDGDYGWGFYYINPGHGETFGGLCQLSRAPRYIRVAAYGKIDQLLKELQSHVNEETQLLETLSKVVPEDPEIGEEVQCRS